MFDEVTAQRLDRLERETTRRKWDSAVSTATQRGQPEQLGGSPLSAAGEKSLAELLDERFDRLERKHDLVEWQIGRLEQSNRLGKRAWIASLVAVAGLAVGFGAFVGHAQAVGAFARRPTEAGPRRGGSMGVQLAEKITKLAPSWNLP